MVAQGKSREKLAELGVELVEEGFTEAAMVFQIRILNVVVAAASSSGVGE